jgi:PadR family transcriptional regulator PadR
VQGDAARDWLAQARRGVVELGVLLLLDHAPSYGYQLALALGAYGKALAASEGTLYPLLRRLQREGVLSASWFESQDGPPRKVYALTDHGRALLRGQLAEWQQLTQAMDALTRSITEDKEVPDGSQRHLAVSGGAAPAARPPAGD